MPKCSVISCPNNSRHMRKKDGVSYFSFPRNPIRCSEWTVIIAKARNEINFKPFKGTVVCSNHFPASDIYTTTKGFSRLNKNAKPILHLNKKTLGSNENPDQDNTHVNSGHDNNQQSIEQNNESIELSYSIDNEFGNNEEIYQRTKTVFLQDKSREMEQNEENIELSFNEDSSRKIEQSPSTSLSIGSILDTPRKTVTKRKLNLCEKKIIQKKNRQINRLQKQNKRLIKKNTTLKNIIKSILNP